MNQLIADNADEQRNAATTVAPSKTRRYHELDALRGLAALSVILLHFYEMWMIGDHLLLRFWQRVLLGVARFFYAGSEAVILFFVLSGLVLALPYLKGTGQSYITYLVRRVLRIYGPYVVALTLAFAGAAIWHSHTYHGYWASGIWSEPLHLKLMAQQLGLLWVFNGQYLPVSWTLLQEMRISIVFPLLVLVVSRLPVPLRLVLAALATLVATLVIHRHVEADYIYNFALTLHYTAFFILGIVLASQLHNIHRWWRKTSRTAHLLILLISFISYMYDHTIADLFLRHVPLLRQESLGWLAISNWLAAIGAVGWIVIGLNAPAARKLLLSALAQFLGHISFSLYLVHTTILFALTIVCKDRVSLWIQLPIFVLLSIGISWFFCVAVEKPFIRWGRAVRFGSMSFKVTKTLFP